MKKSRLILGKSQRKYLIRGILQMDLEKTHLGGGGAEGIWDEKDWGQPGPRASIQKCKPHYLFVWASLQRNIPLDKVPNRGCVKSTKLRWNCSFACLYCIVLPILRSLNDQPKWARFAPNGLTRLDSSLPPTQCLWHFASLFKISDGQSFITMEWSMVFASSRLTIGINGYPNWIIQCFTKKRESWYNIQNRGK